MEPLGGCTQCMSIARSTMFDQRNFGIRKTTKPLYRCKCSGANQSLIPTLKFLRECNTSNRYRPLTQSNRVATSVAPAVRERNTSTAAVHISRKFAALYVSSCHLAAILPTEFYSRYRRCCTTAHSA